MASRSIKNRVTALENQIGTIKSQITNISTNPISREVVSQPTTNVPSMNIQSAPATQNYSSPATATNIPSITPVPQGMKETDQNAVSVILGGGANTGGAYQGTTDVPLGVSGQDNQFLRRMGSILLR